MSERIHKVNSLMRQEVGAVILRELEMPKGSLITVTRVTAEPDLKTAKVFVRMYPTLNELTLLEYLKKNSGRIQKSLNRKLEMKFVPQLTFFLDSENLGEPEENDVEEILDSLRQSLESNATVN